MGTVTAITVQVTQSSMAFHRIKKAMNMLVTNFSGMATVAASTRRLDWTHETSQSRILRRAAVDDMQDTPPVLAPLRSVLLSVQAHHQRRRNDRFCRCQRVEVDACSEGSEPHLADPRPMELARAGRPADRPWKRQNGFVEVMTLLNLHAKVV